MPLLPPERVQRRMRAHRLVWILPFVLGCAAAPSDGDDAIGIERTPLAVAGADWRHALERSLLDAETARSADASARGLVAALEKLLAHDAILEASGQPILTGRRAIARFLETLAPTVKATFDPRRVSVS